MSEFSEILHRPLVVAESILTHRRHGLLRTPSVAHPPVTRRVTLFGRGTGRKGLCYLNRWQSTLHPLSSHQTPQLFEEISSSLRSRTRQVTLKKETPNKYTQVPPRLVLYYTVVQGTAHTLSILSERVGLSSRRSKSCTRGKYTLILQSKSLSQLSCEQPLLLAYPPMLILRVFELPLTFHQSLRKFIPNGSSLKASLYQSNSKIG